MTRAVPAAVLAAILAGCQTPPPVSGTPDPQARYPQRDLTVAWSERSYWRWPPDQSPARRPVVDPAEVAPAPSAPDLAQPPAPAGPVPPPAAVGAVPARRTACARGACR